MKTFLVPFVNDQQAVNALSAAALLARRYGGHVEGVFVHQPTQAIVTDIVPAAYIAPQEDVWSAGRDDALARFKEVAVSEGLAFGDFNASDDKPTAGWSDRHGTHYQVIGDFGRLFNLVVVGRTDSAAAAGWNVTAEAALFESGRPVLISPPAPVKEICKTVVVAWNGSTETARTIGLGMGLLQTSESVLVLTVEGGSVPGPSGEDVAAHLARNGFNATAKSASANGRSVGQTILDECDAVGADLLFKGAYTQSRLRQLIFGGPSEHILKNAKCPVFMAH